MATSHETYTVRRLNVEVPGVREFQQLYEQAVPANPVEEIVALVQRGASWAEVLDAHAEWAPHGFLIYFRNDVHPVMAARGRRAGLHRLPDGQRHHR